MQRSFAHAAQQSKSWSRCRASAASTATDYTLMNAHIGRLANLQISTLLDRYSSYVYLYTGKSVESSISLSIPSSPHHHPPHANTPFSNEQKSLTQEPDKRTQQKSVAVQNTYPLRPRSHCTRSLFTLYYVSFDAVPRVTRRPVPKSPLHSDFK